MQSNQTTAVLEVLESDVHFLALVERYRAAMNMTRTEFIEDLIDSSTQIIENTFSDYIFNHTENLKEAEQTKEHRAPCG